MSSCNCCFLTCIQIFQEAGKVLWYSHLFQNFSQFVVIHIVKGFSIVKEAELDVFLEFPCFLYAVGNLISGSSAFFQSSLYIWKFSVYILLKPSLKGFAHNIASMWSEHNRTLGWAFFLIALLWDWNVNFSSPVATAELSKFADILSVALSQHHLLGFEIACWNSITSTRSVNSNTS